MDPVDYRDERVTTGTPPASPAAEPAQPYAAAPATTTTRTSASRTATYSGGTRAAQLVWLIVGIVDVILALDFIFRAAAGANTGFAHYVYRIGGALASPFDGIFSNTTIVNGGPTFIRWADVLALVIYTLAALAVARLVQIVATPRSGPA